MKKLKELKKELKSVKKIYKKDKADYRRTGLFEFAFNINARKEQIKDIKRKIKKER